MNRDAVISDCGLYRYSLTRAWGFGVGRVCFIMYNPSTADGREDDPTIRRCIGFAQSWGYESLEVVNLYAFRATKPTAVRKAADPVGPHNNQWIHGAVVRSGLAIAAWGVPGAERGRQLRAELAPIPLYHLGLSKARIPMHPLYRRSDTQPTVWS